MSKLNNKKLFDKNKFKPWEQEKRRRLKNLSMKEAIAIEERLLSSALIWELRKNFFEDNPVCLKMLLQKKA
ncbi:MAG: hypothetical protein A3G38_00135 [Omnitrophica WOR_2 bacterium RIFCSPLOWO2_12_FULL_51_8]|nr:MAG: hypothetical protein A3G38_00135 [Omnitrophica WOR_2 bacterium RIFCSPLOWO2_12_FULL_51_8]